MHCYLKRRPAKDPNAIFYIYEYDKQTGQCERVSTGTRDRAEAEQKLARHVIKIPQRQLISDATLVKIMLRYWEHHGQHIFARDTARRVLGLVAEHAPEVRLYDWPIPRQKEFAAKLASKDGTRRRYFGVVRAAVQWAFDGGELPTMPPLLKINAVDGEGARSFELAELQALCEACEHEHERRFMLLMLTTAPRPGATLDLTWDRIDAQTGVINYVVPGRKVTKKRRAKSPLCAPALAYFNERRSVGPVIQWNGRQLKKHRMTFDRLCERAGVNGSAYGIRKAVSIWMRKESVHEWDIKGMLGHRISGETERYAHYRPEYMRAAATATERLLRAINPSWLQGYLVGGTGIEPVTSCMSSKRSTTELTALSSGQSLANAPRETLNNQALREAENYHVKDGVLSTFQWLKPANDD